MFETPHVDVAFCIDWMRGLMAIADFDQWGPAHNLG